MKTLFKVQDGEIKAKLPKMSKRQIYILKNFESSSEIIEYIRSFTAGRRRSVNTKYMFPRVMPDALAAKRPGSTLRKLEQMCDGNRQFSPVLKNFHYGVEIECFIPREKSKGETCDYCNENDGDECSCGYESNDRTRMRYLNLLKQNKIKNVSIKHDGSIRCDGEYWAVEFTILVNENDWTNLSKLCKLLKDVGAKVNKSCGLHVHLDARTLDPVSLRSKARNFGKALNVLKYMVPESRRINDYCRLGVSRMTGERYYAVNLTAYRKYKSLEIRLHSGTTNFQKIREWCTILKNIFDASPKVFPKKVLEVNDLAGIVSEHSLEYMQQRIDFFKDEDVKDEFADTDYQEAS